MPQKLDVITVGSALRDVMYYTDECCVKTNKQDPLRPKLMCVEYGAKIRSDKVHFGFGGGGCNTAINFRGLGLHTGIITSIGFDLDGRGLKAHLDERGINTALVQITQEHRTGLSFLVVDEKTGDHTAYIYYGATQNLEVRSSSLARYPTKWYYIASLNAHNWPQLLACIFAAPYTLHAWNPGSAQLAQGYRGLRAFLSQTAILLLNKDEATELILSHSKHGKITAMRDMLRIIFSWGPRLVVITNSRRGSHAYDGQKYYYAQAGASDPVDTTGAGDCYGSTFVAAYVRYKGDIQKAMRLATINADSLVRSIGAQSGLLSWPKLIKSSAVSKI